MKTLLYGFFGIALAGIAPLHAMAQETLIWSDEFNGAGPPDQRFWSYDIGFGDNGWGNRELQFYTDDPANASQVDGALRIRAVPGNDDRPFTSARIRTQDKVTIQYGTIEARIRVPDLANGLWPAFWTLGNNFSEVGWPFCGELDVMEMGNTQAILDGVVNRRVGSTAHWDNDGQKVDFGQSINAPQDLNNDFHVFRMEWTPSFVTTYLDGQRIWQIDIRPASCTSCTEFHQPHFLILNLAVGGTYPGRFSPESITAPFPADMLIDWVRVYDNGFTILGGSGVEDMDPKPIGPGHSGSWYNADQDGHGFSLEFGELADGSPFAVGYWYIYDSVGNPLFMVGSGVPSGNAIDLDFVSPVGMQFGVFDPLTEEQRPFGGTGRFEFTDESNGVFSYQPSAFSVNEWGHSTIEALPVTKLFGIPTANETFSDQN